MYDNEYILELNKYTIERIEAHEYIEKLERKKEEQKKQKESTKN